MKFIYLSGSISVFSKYSTLWKKNFIYAVQITLKWMPWCQQQQCSILKQSINKCRRKQHSLSFTPHAAHLWSTSTASEMMLWKTGQIRRFTEQMLCPVFIFWESCAEAPSLISHTHWGTYLQVQGFLARLSFPGILFPPSCLAGLPTPATQIVLMSSALIQMMLYPSKSTVLQFLILIMGVLSPSVAPNMWRKVPEEEK